MQSMNVSPSDPLKQFADAQIEHGGYSSVGEYVCDLIRAIEKCKAKEQF
jgi:Arc/MetJ-type ribon-helix-helix transcriptional regulator